MRQLLRPALLLATVLIGLTACQKQANADARPITVLGEWLLAVSGGGLTGIMTPMPAGQDHRVVFGPDSAYAEYYNGKLISTSTFQLRRHPSRTGEPDEQLLIFKNYTDPSGQPHYNINYITLLTANELNTTTGSGCALNSNWVRVSSPSQLIGTR